MILYHGTSTKHLPAIFAAEALRPRGKSGRTNWGHNGIHSNPDTVYLTDVYAPYFAFNATKELKTESAVVFEVDTDRPPIGAMVPDEDFLEQATRSGGRVEGLKASASMKERTEFFRDRLHRWTGDKSKLWQESISHLGTCGAWGGVPISAVTRYAVINLDAVPHMVLMASDPTITLINHRLCGAKYRALTALIFGKQFTPEEWLGETIASFGQALGGKLKDIMPADQIGMMLEGAQEFLARSKAGVTISNLKP